MLKLAISAPEGRSLKNEAVQFKFCMALPDGSKIWRDGVCDLSDLADDNQVIRIDIRHDALMNRSLLKPLPVKHDASDYHYTLEYDLLTNRWIARCREFNGLFVAADAPGNAMDMAVGKVQRELKRLQDEGKDVPSPRMFYDVD